jgi:hypothetical protein
MLLNSITVAAAGLAATCTAFLLPPEVSEADIAIADKVSSLAEVAPDFARVNTVLVDCPGCPIQVRNRHGHVKVKNGKPNHLILNFAVNHPADESGDRLLLNGFELYPNSDPFHNVLSALQTWDKKPQVEEDERERDPETTQLKSHHKMRPQHLKEIIPSQLGFSLQIHPAAEDKDGQEYKLIDLDLQIIEVGNRFVDGVPNVNVRLIKDGSGNLAIAGVESTASQLQTSPTDKQEECTTLMCKWLAIIKAKMSHMKTSCHRKPGSSANNEVVGENQMPGHFKHHGGRPHFHHMHSHHRSWAQLFKNITTHILLPIVIGIFAGVTASLSVLFPPHQTLVSRSSD